MKMRSGLLAIPIIIALVGLQASAQVVVSNGVQMGGANIAPTSISGLTYTATDTTIVAQWTTSTAADSNLFCGGKAGIDNGAQQGVTAHQAIVTGLIQKSSYSCFVTSLGVSSSPQSVVTIAAPIRTPILGASLGSVTTTANNGDSLYNFLSSDNNTYMAIDDSNTPGPSANQSLMKITNESTLALASVNGMSAYGTSTQQNGIDGPNGSSMSYKESGLFGMNGCLYMYSSRTPYGNPQIQWYGNVIADNCNHGATWNNHQAPATFNANGSPDGPGVSMFTQQIEGWGSFVRYAADDGTMGYLTAGNGIDGANGYVYINYTDGYWNNGNHLYLKRVPRAYLASLTAANKYQYWCGPTSPAPSDFVNDGNWCANPTAAVAIYSASGQTSANDEIYVPGFNYYVLLEWYQSPAGVTTNTIWVAYSAPTPAGPWTQIYTATWNPSGWYNPIFMQRAIAANSSIVSATANVIFTGDYSVLPGTYYHPSYAAMTLKAPLFNQSNGLPFGGMASGENGGLSSTITTGATLTTGSGNSVACLLLVNGVGSTISSVSDGTNSYTAVGSQVNGTFTTGYFRWYLSSNVSAVTNATVTVSGTSIPAASTIVCWPLQGNDSFDTTAGAVHGTTTGGTTVTTSTFNTAFSNAEIVLAGGFFSGSVKTPTPGTGYFFDGIFPANGYLAGEHGNFFTTQTGISASFTYGTSGNLEMVSGAFGR